MLTHQLVRLGETKGNGALGKLLVHFVCTTDQSICSNSAILGATDSLSTHTNVSQFVSQEAVFISICFIGAGRLHPRYLRIIYTAICTDLVFKLVTTYQLPLVAMPLVTGNAHLWVGALSVLIHLAGHYR